MATWFPWTYPSAQLITGTTKINEADNKLQAGQADIEDWVNGTDSYVGAGLTDFVQDYLDDYFTSYSDNTVAVEW